MSSEQNRQMLTKDDRQTKSILAALHDLTTALQSSHYQQERGVYTQQIPKTEDHIVKALGFLGSVKDSLDAFIDESKTFQRQWLRLQWLVFFGAAAAFVGASIYANIARLQKATMDATLSQLQKEFAASEVTNTLARRTLQSAINAERPWVGITFRIQDWTMGRNATATAILTNSGRRPAKITRAQFDSNEYSVFPDNPRYRRDFTRGPALILPSGSLTTTQRLGVVTQAELDDLGLKRHIFFIYASLDYEDVLTHSVHWTHACWQYLPGVQNTTSGFVKCSTYNDIDEDKIPTE